MSEEELKALESARAAATGGEWRAHDEKVGSKEEGLVCTACILDEKYHANATFIAIAANEWGRMIAEIKRLREGIDENGT